MYSKQHKTEQMWLKMESLTQLRKDLLKLCEWREKCPRSKQLDQSQQMFQQRITVICKVENPIELTKIIHPKWMKFSQK